MEVARMPFGPQLAALEGIRDPRRPQEQRYSLSHLLLFAVLAVLAGSPGEIAAAPTLISELGLTGVLFTADALHCQKDTFTQTTATGNALLVRVKDNQPTLHDRLAGLCASQPPFDSYETVDRRRHGRQQHRRVEVFDTAGHLDADWQPLIACVARVS